MTPQKPGRGRPKGTGLDDASHLRAIAGLIAADPELKPTTAIKALGITDPSVIRRLRDKYSAMDPAWIAKSGQQLSFGDEYGTPDQMPSAAAIHPAAQDTGAQSARSAPLLAPKTPTKIEHVAPVQRTALQNAPAPTRTRRPAFDHLRSPSETELPAWMGVGLSMYALSMEAQFAVLGAMFQWPPVAAVVTSQVAFTELAVAMTRSMIKPGPQTN
jgi:hypothetical protein